ncbi:hypothetical protein EDB84DRAFT_1682175 [Lactarius hengduanensis]|nr:hypothetical protein EDB84DRAFT_1682175 [Lactarius hengduanensis]
MAGSCNVLRIRLQDLLGVISYYQKVTRLQSIPRLFLAYYGLGGACGGAKQRSKDQISVKQDKEIQQISTQWKYFSARNPAAAAIPAALSPFPPRHRRRRHRCRRSPTPCRSAAASPPSSPSRVTATVALHVTAAVAFRITVLVVLVAVIVAASTPGGDSGLGVAMSRRQRRWVGGCGDGLEPRQWVGGRSNGLGGGGDRLEVAVMGWRAAATDCVLRGRGGDGGSVTLVMNETNQKEKKSNVVSRGGGGKGQAKALWWVACPHGAVRGACGSHTTTAQPRDDSASRLRNDGQRWRESIASRSREDAVTTTTDHNSNYDYHGHGHDEVAGDEAAAEGRAVGTAVTVQEWRRRGNGDGVGMVTV